MTEAIVILRDPNGSIHVRIDAPHLAAARRLMVDANYCVDSLADIDAHCLPSLMEVFAATPKICPLACS